MSIDEHIIEAFTRHAEEQYPKESCGLVQVIRGKMVYTPIDNIAEKPLEKFVMHPIQRAEAEDRGEILAIVHSHPNTPPQPSDADKVSCEREALPFIIVNWPVGNYHIYEPCGFQLGLYGRRFAHGIVDCYSFVQDWYKQERGIILPDFNREDDWWDKGQNLYLDNFTKADFVEVDDLKVGDGILMNVFSKVPNHAAILVEDGIIGHHMMNKLSCREVYGGWFKKITAKVVRHKSML